MKNFTFQLDKLIKIYNIPLEENWSEWIIPENYTVYKYWFGLGLFTKFEFDEIYSSRKIVLNPVFIQFFRNLDSLFKPQYYKDGLVADVGSGFGFITFWLKLSGARTVYTIGDPKRIGFIQKLYNRAVELKILEEGKISFKPGFVKVGDISLAKNIINNSLDLVLLHDTLEHITPRIFPWLVKSAYNNLKPGGLFISKAQNTDSPSGMKVLQVVWEEGDKNIYINQRLKIIKDKINIITEIDANKLAKHTRGLDSIDFYTALDQYITEKKIPNHNLNIAPIDIEFDVPYEGDTGIDRIKLEFFKNNFQSVKVYPDMMASRRSRYFQALSKIFPSIFLKYHIFDENTVFLVKK